jgi:hypothetical protein
MEGHLLERIMRVVPPADLIMKFSKLDASSTRRSDIACSAGA